MLRTQYWPTHGVESCPILAAWLALTSITTMPLGTAGVPRVSGSQSGPRPHLLWKLVPQGATGFLDALFSPTDCLLVYRCLSDMSPGARVRRLDRVSSDLPEFPGFPSRRVERLPTLGQLLTVPVTVTVHTTTTTTSITTHLSMASATGMAAATTGVLPSGSVPWSTMATPTAYTGPAYLPYAGHAPPSGPTWARSGRKAAGQFP